jgi:hypothetical protein
MKCYIIYNYSLFRQFNEKCDLKFTINAFTDSLIHYYTVFKIRATQHAVKLGRGKNEHVFSPTRLRDSNLHSTCFLSLHCSASHFTFSVCYWCWRR